MDNTNMDTIRKELENLIKEKYKYGDEGLVCFYRQVENKLRKCYPKTLFRYRTCSENTFNALAENQLWLSSPAVFNDPYDVLMLFDLSIWKKNTIITMADSQTVDFSRLNIFTEKQLFLIANIIKAFSKEDYDMLSSFLTRFLQDDKSLQNENILSSFLKEYSHLRIACLSEDVSNPVMWAHYAENATGFAIEYNTNNMRSICNKNMQICKSLDCHESDCKKTENWCEKRSAGHLFPVIYSDSRYDFSEIAIKLNLVMLLLMIIARNKPKIGDDTIQQLWNNIINEESLIYHKLSLYKSTSWNYEKEWRLITHGYGQKKFRFVKYSPCAIYLGASMKNENIKKLEKIIFELNKTTNASIKIFKMVVNYKKSIPDIEPFR